MIVTDTKLESPCRVSVILDSNRKYFVNVMLDFDNTMHDSVFNLKDLGNTREYLGNTIISGKTLVMQDKFK